MAFRLLPLLAALAFIVGCGPAEPPKPTVSAFVASSAAPTVESLATRFEQAQGVRVEVHAGSSATLAKQALSGATMHVFLSADRQWMDELVKAGLVDGADVSDLLANRLVMVAAPETSLDPSRPDALRSLRRFAMGDPASVPVGRYAKEALEKAGWWSMVEGAVVTLPDARAVVKILESGEAEAGVIYASDAHGSPSLQRVAFFPGEALYPAAASKSADPLVRRFLAFLRTEEAKAAFEAAGFRVVPAGERL
jgi:molybdate transport system substrate-binding protein